MICYDWWEIEVRISLGIFVWIIWLKCVDDFVCFDFVLDVCED